MVMQRGSVSSGCCTRSTACSGMDASCATHKKQAPAGRGLFSEAKSCLQLLHAHRLTIARALDGVAHFAVDQCEQRMVLADADIAAGLELGAALTNDDRAGRNGLAAEHLDAEHLRL